MAPSQEIILVVNPGSTSTKLVVVEGEKTIAHDTLSHSAEELARFRTIWDQFDSRLQVILDWALRYARNPNAVVTLGGLFRPVPGGVYAVNERMLADARENFQGEHASNLGCALAQKLAARFQCPAFVVDPVSVDEFEPLARYSGHPLIQRRTLSHAPSLHATSSRAAAELGRTPEDTDLVVAHMGGGISVAAIRGGKIIDVNDASSDGPFSPERTGGLPLQPVISLCFSGKHTEQEMRAFVMGKGGMIAYLGTNSVQEVEKRIAGGDEQVREVFEAMAYQIAKEIGAMATVLRGLLHAVVLTGGLARSSTLVGWIRQRVQHLGPLLVYPGDDEMTYLARRALRALRGDEPIRNYP